MKMKVHNHGIDPGCAERLLGDCMIGELQASEHAVGFSAGLSQYTLVEETVTVDGVAYDAEKIKTLILERHAMAHEITALRTRLSRADRHLRLRTAALVRVIARRGPQWPRKGW